MARLVHEITQRGIVGVQSWRYRCYTLVQTQVPNRCDQSAMGSLEDQCDNETGLLRSNAIAKVLDRIAQPGTVTCQTKSNSKMALLEDQNKTFCQFKGNNDPEVLRKIQLGESVSRKDKISFLIGTLLDIKDSKEAVYGVLDAWVAWEQNFPIGPLKRVLLTLEEEQHWHRVVQVIKWMLSKGQGNTMGTYGQLIRALEMDHRAEEAHEIWAKKIGNDLHSVPWQLCKLMISVYYRNNMLEKLVKLFKGLEAFDRKPPQKSIVRKVANAYETLGLIEERDRVLDKYKTLFSEPGCSKKKSMNISNKNKDGEKYASLQVNMP
ncbi:pentatricopeptide repeat-containing protein At4g18975, chloroplastic-like [Actinidia eriantha]|uniref:pentatricopeptide repeat-containing protein At4g18975, chloroplastic-like n=1 Tax=Actinidia eriantha TaxID=165200 RepID=UPI002590902A|nr:pentatricopeptide repeat-containing protein At4g18975, chloroplastic-like [Actinidia eriantha]XP_057495981.1 pentatricopeptide repeat-containing protein At4g18975, chloroplastic-like [Actinidia eriantha]